MPFDPVLRDAQEQSTAPDRLVELSTHRAIAIRIEVAKNPATPLSSLREMGGDRSAKIREAIAQNPAIPDDLLLTLSGDASTSVRQSAALSAQGRQAILLALAVSSDSAVREIVAGLNNPAEQLDREIQDVLSQDYSWEARARIARSTQYRDLFERLLADAHPQVRGQSGANPRATLEDFERLTTDRSAVTRRIAVAVGVRYPSEDQLMKLARDRSAEVQWAVIARVGTPRAAVEIVAEEGDHMNRNQALAVLKDGFFPSTVIESAQKSRDHASLLGPFV